LSKLSKKVTRKILLLLGPYLGYLLIRLIYATCKKKFYITSNIPKEPFIGVLWHGEMLMQLFMYKKFRKEIKTVIMISEHFDGEIIAKILKLYGFDSVRGSSSKGSVKVLKETFKAIDNGYDVAITPDGPRGPYHSLADGVVLIAQKKRMKIIATRYKASKFWQLNSWDKFIIPKPFSTLYFYASEPFSVEGLSKEEAKRVIKRRLDIFDEKDFI